MQRVATGPANPTRLYTIGIKWHLNAAKATATRAGIDAIRIGMTRDEAERKLGEEACRETYYGPEDSPTVTAHYPSLVVTYGSDGTVTEWYKPQRKGR